MMVFTARGLSMDPLIKEGDKILAEPIPKKDIRLGDIILFKSKDSHVLVAHRVIRINKSVCVLQGDFSDDADDIVAYEDVIGKAAAVERAGKLINLDTAYSSILKFIWNNFFVTGSFILPLLKWRSIYFKINLLIGPRFFIKPPEQALLTIKDKFNQKEEVEFYSNYVTAGLEDWEYEAVKRYLKKGNSILNIGCSAGREAIALVKLGFGVTGIDISSEMIVQANKNAGVYGVNVRFEVMPASEINFPEGSFDCCLFSQNVYSFIPSSPLRIESLRRIKKCLKPGGLVFLHPYIIKRRLLSAGNFIDVLRGLRNFILPSVFLSQPGDIWIRGVSPASRMDTFCFCHYFRSEKEVLKEIKAAGFKPVDSAIDDIFIAKGLFPE